MKNVVETQWAIFLELDAAVAKVQAEVAAAQERSPKWIEQRRGELIALKRLMEQDSGAGKGRVRLLPRSKVL